MIKISSDTFNTEEFIKDYEENSIERKFVNTLSSSEEVYNYNSTEQLIFELKLRMNIISSAKELNKSKFTFKTFRESKCNLTFWERTDEGGFLLKPGITPYDAIDDIFKNSSEYGNECATAMVIVFLRAVHYIYAPELFNKIFPKIQLMDWQYLNENLRVHTLRKVIDYFPGDCRYFKNPEVDPETPEWQGENVIDLGNEAFYGHGVGIRNAEGIINSLNKHRIKESKESAFLTNSVTRIGFKHLFNIYNNSKQ